MNDTKPVSDEARNRVRTAAEDLGYRGHRVARALRTGRTQSLGLVLPDLTNPFFPALAQAIEARARRHGYLLVLVDSGRSATIERRGLRLMTEHGVDGLIWIPSPGARFSERPACPTVLIDRPRRGFDSVASDDEAGGRLLGERAVALGHEHVVLIHGPRSATSTRARRAGLLAGLAGRATIEGEYHAPYAVELPPEVRRALATTRATWVACGNDVLAIGALDALRCAGRSVPGEIGVVGFDDIAWASLVTPALTTVAHRIDQVGAAAVELVLQRVEEPGAPDRNRVLPVSLVPRTSDAPASRREQG